MNSHVISALLVMICGASPAGSGEQGSVCISGAGACCEANKSPGCDDGGSGCCEAVCECDPYCCDTDWDEHCATTNGRGCGAAVQCPQCVDADDDGIPDGFDVCCNTPEGIAVDERGRPRGDLDDDCDVDLDDHAVFITNVTGPLDEDGACCLFDPELCDDSDLCTTDACDAVSGCSNTAVECAEGEVCNAENGTCVDPGCLLDADCDDGNPCTTNVCNINRDCQLTNNTASCDDGLFCNGTDTCSGATCSVNAGDPCVRGGECANQCDESGNTCNLPTGTRCTDDGDVCTDDLCSGGLCTHPNNTAACDDDVFCNGTDSCLGGTCSVHTGDPCPGPDNDDNCAESCNEDSDDCTAPDPDGLICDDSLFCTETDTCSGGDCIGMGSPCPRLCEEPARCFDCFTSLDCDDGVLCTDDICGLAGQCIFFPNSVTCNDNDLCTDDTCDAVTGCSNVEAVVCGGGEFCNPSTGECEPMICEAPEECDDADACTDDTCAPEGVCRNTVVDCDDGLFCNGAEQCDSEMGCMLGSEPCDDGVDCTDDCDELADECTNTPNDDVCTDDGIFCNGSEMCDPVAGCISPGKLCPPGDTCIESSQACDTRPTTWSSTQTLLPEIAYSPPESYELDVSRQLTIAHLGLSEANLRLWFPNADITVFATDVLPGQDTLMYRTEQEVGPITRITTQTLTINDFHLSFTRVGDAFTATWAFDYIVANTDNPIFNPDEIRQLTGTQSGDVSEDGTVITWTSVEGTRCTLDQGICNNPVELTEINFPLGMWTRD